MLLSTLQFPSISYAQSVEVTDPGFVLLDVLLYRPAGLVATAVGTGIFLGLSPLTALASIPAPHDAFQKTLNILVVAPAAYTFIRPVGERKFMLTNNQLPHQKKRIAPTKPSLNNTPPHP